MTEDDINALVDDELCGREQRRIASHVAVCDQCSRLAGSSLATKRLLSAKLAAVDPPAESWANLVAALDGADGLARATGRRRGFAAFPSVPALAAVGVLMIVAGLAWQVRSTVPSGQSAMFVRNHLAACGMLSPYAAGSSVHDVVASSPGGAVWVAQARWLVPYNKEFLDHTIFRVGPTPISEFVISSRSFDRRGMGQLRTPAGAEYLVRTDSSGSIVAWETGGLAHVLVGRTRLEDLVGLAEARKSQGPRMRSM